MAVDTAAVCEGSDDDGYDLYVVDCQVCRAIIDTVSEQDRPDARARARVLADEHNATYHPEEG